MWRQMPRLKSLFFYAKHLTVVSSCSSCSLFVMIWHILIALMLGCVKQKMHSRTDLFGCILCTEMLCFHSSEFYRLIASLGSTWWRWTKPQHNRWSVDTVRQWHKWLHYAAIAEGCSPTCHTCWHWFICGNWCVDRATAENSPSQQLCWLQGLLWKTRTSTESSGTVEGPQENQPKRLIKLPLAVLIFLSAYMCWVTQWLSV